MKPKQLDMFSDVTDFGKPIDRPKKGRWYVITRKWNTEALYRDDMGRYFWDEYEPLDRAPELFTSPVVARNVGQTFDSLSTVRMWPYGVPKAGRSK